MAPLRLVPAGNRPDTLKPGTPAWKAAKELWRPIDGKVQQMFKNILAQKANLLTETQFIFELGPNVPTNQLGSFHSAFIDHLRKQLDPKKNPAWLKEIRWGLATRRSSMR